MEDFDTQQDAGIVPEPNGVDVDVMDATPAGQQVATPAQVQTQKQQPASAKERRTLTLPSAALAKIRQAERAKGAKQALSDRESLAKALGFSGLQELEDMMANKTNKPAPRNASGPNAQARAQQRTADQQQSSQGAQRGGLSERAFLQLQRQNQKLLDEKREANRLRAAEERKRRELQSQLEATQAEHELRQAAMLAGVKDTDYALFQVRQHLKGKSPEECMAFNETEFFSSLKERAPYIFGVSSSPATTTAPAKADAGTANVQAPSVGHVKQSEGVSAPFNARTASPADFANRLRELNLKGIASPSLR